MMSILYWFMAPNSFLGQMGLVLNDLIYRVLRLNLHTDSKHAPKTY